MKKLPRALAFLAALLAPALLYGWRHLSWHEDPVWKSSPDKMYLRNLEDELLSGQLTRAQFIDRLREKALLTSKAPLPTSNFVDLYQLASPEERDLLDPLFPSFLKNATEKEARQLSELKKSFP